MPTQMAGDYPKLPHTNVAAFAQRAWTNLPKFLASPLNAPSMVAFDEAALWLNERFDNDRPIVLDSGCGKGLSTLRLAQKFPDAVVIGVDRSEGRVAKGQRLELPENALLVRAELATFWRLMLEAEHAQSSARRGLSASRVSKHYLLYPNPQPKPGRLNLRWHGHASLPVLLAIGDDLELRSNWRVYLEEFSQATSLTAAAAAESDASEALGGELNPQQANALSHVHQRVAMRAGRVHELEPLRLGGAEEAISAFERKFHEVGEPLWSWRCSVETPLLRVR